MSFVGYPNSQGQSLCQVRKLWSVLSYAVDKHIELNNLTTPTDSRVGKDRQVSLSTVSGFSELKLLLGLQSLAPDSGKETTVIWIQSACNRNATETQKAS